MSEDSLPLEQWPAGIQQASVPANENALRVQALLSRALSVENDAPGTEYNGAVYIVGDTPAGAFASFAEHDIALYEYDSWYAWSPVLGTSMVIADERMVFDGTEWVTDPSVAGGGGGSGIVESIVAGTGITVDDTDPANPVVSMSGAATGLPWFYVTDYRDGGDPDDTSAIQAAIDAAGAAGGGVVYFPARQGTGASGEYIVGGALQDTSGANAQILLPDVPYVTDPQITIVLMGEFPPPTIFSVVGDRPTPVGHSIIEGTLNTGSGGKLLTGYSSTSSGNWTNVQVVVRNLTFRMPEDPVFTALDFRLCSNADLDQVVIDTGSYYIQGIDEPTTSGSYALRMPKSDNGAHSRLGTVNVCGFYNGIEHYEHSNGFATIGTWACKNGNVFAAAVNHALYFTRIMSCHCQRPIVSTGTSYVNIAQLNVEHAASGWWQTDYDVYDPSNYLRGTVGGWHVVLAGVGVDSTFTVSGAARLNITRLGWENRVEQISISSAVTLEGRHANKHLLHPSADTTARTWTIPANSSVPYPIGTTLTFVNQNGAGALTIAITSDTMRLAGAGTTGSRTLAANGIATAIKTTATEWQINGTGLT